MEKKEKLEILKNALEKAVLKKSNMPNISFRSMFGGIGVYANEKYFASISDVGLAIKLSPLDHDKLLELDQAAKPLQYGPSAPVSKEFIVVPQHFLDNPAVLGKWVKRSVQYVQLLPKKKGKKKG